MSSENSGKNLDTVKKTRSLVLPKTSNLARRALQDIEILTAKTNLLATTTKTLGSLNIGDRVVDKSWEWEHRTGNNYTGTGETKPVSWIVVAKDHYGSISGVTLLAEEVVGDFTFDDSTNIDDFGSNHWGNSDTHSTATHGLRPWLNSTGIHAGEGFYNAFSQSFKDAVLTTTVPNTARQYGPKFQKMPGTAYTTQNNVFIPSMTELGGTYHSWTYEIGTAYPYFLNTTDVERDAKLAGDNCSYWTRSPDSGDAGLVRFVVSGGDFSDSYVGAYCAYIGVRPALNLKSDTLVSDSPNPDGYFEILGEEDTASETATINFAGGVYVGDVHNNRPHGRGTYTWPSGEKYVGEFQNGKRHGQGTNTWPDGEKYVGEYRDGVKHGRGTLTWPDGEKYVGEYRDGVKHGRGTLTWSEGEKYVGEYRDGKRHGQGTNTWPNGTSISGEWINDKYAGSKQQELNK